jgi:hypothetical protein
VNGCAHVDAPGAGCPVVADAATSTEAPRRMLLVRSNDVGTPEIA